MYNLQSTLVFISLMMQIFARRLYFTSKLTRNRPFQMAASSTQMPLRQPLAESIKLSKEESDLFAMFRRMVEAEKLNTTIRVAGGWVRDKLLNRAGKNDIDIALDNMTGAQFAIKLNHWSQSQGGAGIQFGVIQQNPDKSKHLETATAMLGKFEIDFVNLRTEEYTTTSRIPEIRIGTPEEDALRRDLTINSLFYNVNSGHIEDFTGRGLTDLTKGIIQTPLPALTTLQDDPLRALRAVRFACRYSFDMAAELFDACGDSSVQLSLKTKVSKERVFQELEQMLDNPFAARACYMLHSLSLMPIILCLPHAVTPTHTLSPSTTPIPIQQAFHINGVATMLCCSILSNWANDSKRDGMCTVGSLRKLLARASDASGNPNSPPMESSNSTYANKLLHFSALTTSGSQHQCPNPLKKKKNTSVTDYLLQHELRMRGKDVDQIERIHQAAKLFTSVLDELQIAPVVVSDAYRLRLGMVIREAGQWYVEGIHLAVSQRIVKASLSESGCVDSALVEKLAFVCGLGGGGQQVSDAAPSSAHFLLDSSTSLGPSRLSIIEAADCLVVAIDQMNLHHAWKLAPLLNGEDLKHIFHNIPKGPAFGQVRACVCMSVCVVIFRLLRAYASYQCSNFSPAYLFLTCQHCASVNGSLLRIRCIGNF